LAADVEPPPLTGERTAPDIASENYWFRRHERAYRFAVRSARGRVLDAGAGEGYGAALLAGSARVVGLGLQGQTVSYAARHYDDVRWVQADACHVPFRAASFDAVVALQLLEHLVCADRFIRRCRELLRPGGVLVLTTPNRATFSPTGVLNPFHAYEYTADELEGLLRVHFDEVRVRGIRAGPTLRLLDLVSGGSLQHRLMAKGYDGLPAVMRVAVRSIRARHFRAGRANGALDLLAVAS
jgi:SAM-dependent methyltransferase